MKELFEISAGTVVGKLHAMAGKNNQDAFYAIHTDDFMIGVVSDGCGSEPYSEVGSLIGCRMLAKMISQRAALISNDNRISEISPLFWENAEEEILTQIINLSGKIGHDAIEVVSNFFLFTLVGFIITRRESLFFSLGDGVIIINGEIKILGPFPDNAPPYLAYNLFTLTPIKPESGIKIQKIVDTDSIESILVGTDGVEHLIKAEGLKIPGRDETVGPISRFWTENCFFENPDMVRRRLTVINRPCVKFDGDSKSIIREYGHLPDDTTLIAVRRKSTA